MKILISIITSLLFAVCGFAQTFTADLTSITQEIFSGDSIIQIIQITNHSNATISLDIRTVSPHQITFTKPNEADWTLEENQDIISEFVKITRANNQGIFNIAQESGFLRDESPKDTEWAYGLTENLTFENYAPWEEAINRQPQEMIGQNMSVHLISEDKYFDILWHSWTCCGEGGGFSYTRTRTDYWLSITESNIEIESNSTAEIAVILNAFNFTDGTYLDDLIIENVAEAETIEIPVEMVVNEAAGIVPSKESLNFDERFLDGSYVKNVTIKNVGSSDLLITAIQINNEAYTISPISAGINPGNSQLFDITFSPTLVTNYLGEVLFISNDPSDPRLTLEVIGSGIEPPEIIANTNSIQSDLNSGENEAQSFTINNSGNSNLIYDITATEISSAFNSPKFNLVHVDPNEPDGGFDVQNVYATHTNDFIYLKIENFEPYVEDQKELLKEVAIVIDSDQNLQTGLDLEQDFDWKLGIDYVIFNDFEGHFILAQYDEDIEDFVDIGPIEHTIDSELGEATFIIDRAHFTDNFNFAILIAGGIVDQIPDPGSGNITLSFAPQWLTLDRSEGTIEAGGNQIISLQLDANNLIDGNYVTQLTINSNDPVTPETFIDVTMSVTGFAEFVGPQNIDFEQSFLNHIDSTYFKVENPGTKTLDLEQILSPNSQINFSSNSISIAPGKSDSITLYLTAENTGNFESHIAFSTNDISFPEITIPVISSVIEAPKVELSSSEIDATAIAGESIIETLTISNLGGSPLNYEIAGISNFALNLNQDFYAVGFENSHIIDPQNAITISIWLYLSEPIDCDNNNNWRSLISKSLSFNTESGFDVVLEDNASYSWSLATENGVVRYGSDEYQNPVGEWTFMSFTYDGTSPKIFANGVEVVGSSDNPTTTGKIISNSFPLRLSSSTPACPQGNGLFPGHVSELRVWNVARSSSDLKEDMNKSLSGNENGLIGYWTFNEGEGQSSTDLTGNGYTANLDIGATSWIEDSRYSWLEINPSEGIIDVGAGSIIEFSFDATNLSLGNYPVEVTINTNDPSTPQVLFPIDFTVTEILGIEDGSEFFQLNVYPNPFDNRITISYELNQKSFVNISIFSITGQMVNTIVNGFQSPGQLKVDWNGSNLNGGRVSGGIYQVLIRIEERKPISHKVLYSGQ